MIVTHSGTHLRYVNPETIHNLYLAIFNWLLLTLFPVWILQNFILLKYKALTMRHISSHLIVTIYSTYDMLFIFSQWCYSFIFYEFITPFSKHKSLMQWELCGRIAGVTCRECYIRDYQCTTLLLLTNKKVSINNSCHDKKI